MSGWWYGLGFLVGVSTHLMSLYVWEPWLDRRFPERSDDDCTTRTGRHR